MQYAKTLGIRVNASITEKKRPVDCEDGTDDECIAAGYAQGNMIVYYGPFIRGEPDEYLDTLAAHEVCHCYGYWKHGPVHTNCYMDLIGDMN